MVTWWHDDMITWWHEASQTIDCMINFSLSTSWRVHIADGCRGIVSVHRGDVLRVCTLFIDKAIFGLTLVFGVLTFFFSLNASNSWVIVRSREEEIRFYAVCCRSRILPTLEHHHQSRFQHIPGYLWMCDGLEENPASQQSFLCWIQTGGQNHPWEGIKAKSMYLYHFLYHILSI